MEKLENYLNENSTTRGEDLARDYIAKIRSDFKKKRFTDSEVEQFMDYLKTFID